MAAGIDLTDVGGTPVTLVGADPNDPDAVAWNFGLTPSTPDVVAVAGPQLENRFPNIRGRWDGRPINHHDAVRKVLGHDLKAHRQSIGSCFPAGTMVLMADGSEKPIEAVVEGDVVCTHVNTARKVVRLVRRTYTGEVTTITTQGSSRPLTATAEHPLLIFANANTSKRWPNRYRLGAARWTKFADVHVRDRVLRPTGVSRDNPNPILDITTYLPSVGTTDRRRRIGSPDLRHQIESDNVFKLYPERRVEVTQTVTKPKAAREFLTTEHGVVCRIKTVERREVVDLPVYNLEVEEEHTYVANGVAVHNCGGHSGSRGMEVLQCVLIATGNRAKFKPVSHAWLYFLARREFNMLGRGDGVASGSIPPVLAKYGALHREEAGDPYESGSSVDDQAARWGAGRMSTADRERLSTLASDNLVTQLVQVKSASELADGLSAGGVAICSDDQGYAMTRDRDGFCSPRGTWYHYHVRSGVVVTSNGRKGFAYDQSWGDTIPDGPLLPGYPPNCFGVDWDVQDRLCRSGDVHVLFGFNLWDLEQGSIDISWWI